MRFVQVWSGAGGPSNNWDNHTDILKELPPIARQVDQPTAALLQDLHDRGMLADTLVVWSTEFGRQPFTQGATGRDHNGGTSVAWLAGAGVKARRRLRRERRVELAAPAKARPTATTCTPRSCTSWASTTPGSPSATTAPTAG